MIIFDTETTGLVQSNGTPLNRQPQMIEFAGIKIDKKMKEVERYETLIDPGVPLPKVITKITGISDSDLVGKPKFPEVYQPIVDFFLGERAIAAHNLSFDLNILTFELRRMEKSLLFPWPQIHICTMEKTGHLCKTKKVFKMTELYDHAFDKKLIQQHRAMADVEALFEIVVWMHKKNLLV